MNDLTNIAYLFSQSLINELKPFLAATVKEAFEEHLATKEDKPPDEDLLTITEAAAFLNCSRTTLWSYTKKNYIDSYRIGQKVFFKKSELMKSLKKRNPKSK
jgi:excisionase family DNA binding protein